MPDGETTEDNEKMRCCCNGIYPDSIRKRIDGKCSYSTERDYVDENGMRVTTKEIRQAVSFVMKYSSPKLSRQKRLKKCFQALLKYPYHRMTDGEPSARKIASCARYMFSAKRGNC